MARKANVLTTDFNAFHARLGSLSHYQSFVSWQLGQAKKGLQGSLDFVEKAGRKNQYGTGTSMVLFNIFHDGKLPIRAPFGKRITEGEQLLPMADEMEDRFNSFILVSVYETLEVFFRASYAKLLYQLRDQITLPDKQAFHKACPKEAKRERTAPYFDAYAERACKRDIKGALTAIRSRLDWATVVTKEWLTMSWDDFVAVLAFCRHKIVHDQGRVSDLRNLNKPQQEFVKDCMGPSFHENQEIILPSSKLTDKVFEGVASYGWAIYILIAARCDMVDDSQFFRPQGGGERKVKPRI